MKLIRAFLLAAAVFGVLVALAGLAATLGGTLIALPGLGLIVSGPFVIMFGLFVTVVALLLRGALRPARAFR